jgi:outer membrane protein assembly complex protein YaeT
MATKQRPLLPPWKRGEPYNPPTLDADLLRLKKFYFDRGFLETTLRVGDVHYEDEQQKVRLTIVIDEGAPTLVTAVHLDGTIPPELPPVPRLLAKVPLRPTERLNKEDFDRSKNALLTLMQDAGYARAQVLPHTEVDPQAHTAVVTFTLQSGARTSFGQLTITGEQQVKELAIQRQLTIKEGQLYSATELADAADAIYELGMFQAVTPKALNPEEDGAPLHIDFEVRERKPRSLQFSIGYSTVEQFRVQALWTFRNLFGGAEQLSLLGRFASPEQKFEARLHLPYALFPRTSFTQTLFVRNEQEIRTDFSGLLAVEEAQPAFDLFSYGGESRLAHRFTKTLTGAIGLLLSMNDFSNVDPEALSDVEEDIAEDNFLLIQFAEVEWNTSKSLLNPVRGFLLRGRVEHSNMALLSDVNFFKLLLEGRHYQRLWGEMILATRLKIGGIQPYGGSTDVPFNVRFFAGGPSSVRGFALNRLGPLNDEGDPIGGQSLIEGSVELRFPIAGDFGGAVFLDFGNVFLQAFTYDLADLRYAIGPGLRYNTLIGPIRLDVGFIVDRRPGEDFGRIEISIGQAF